MSVMLYFLKKNSEANVALCEHLKNLGSRHGCLLLVVCLRLFYILNFKKCFDYKNLYVYSKLFQIVPYTVLVLPKRVIRNSESLM